MKKICKNAETGRTDVEKRRSASTKKQARENDLENLERKSQEGWGGYRENNVKTEKSSLGGDDAKWRLRRKWISKKKKDLMFGNTALESAKNLNDAVRRHKVDAYLKSRGPPSPRVSERLL